MAFQQELTINAPHHTASSLGFSVGWRRKESRAGPCFPHCEAALTGESGPSRWGRRGLQSQSTGTPLARCLVGKGALFRGQEGLKLGRRRKSSGRAAGGLGPQADNSAGRSVNGECRHQGRARAQGHQHLRATGRQRASVGHPRGLLHPGPRHDVVPSIPNLPPPARATGELVGWPGASIGRRRLRSQNAPHGASLKRDHDGGGAGAPRSDRSAGERGQSSDGERAASRPGLRDLPAPPLSFHRPLGLPGAAQGRRRREARVSIPLSCRVPILGPLLPYLCG